MLQYVNVKDLRTNASRVLAMTRRGQTVIVSRKGKPEAIMVPFARDKKVYVRMLLDELGDVMKGSGITKGKALEALDDVRKKIYG